MYLEYRKYDSEYDSEYDSDSLPKRSFFQKFFPKDLNREKYKKIKQHNQLYKKIKQHNQFLKLRCEELELDKQYLQKSYNLLLLKYQVVHEFAFE